MFKIKLQMRLILAASCFQIACYGMQAEIIQFKIDSIKSRISRIKTKIALLRGKLMPLTRTSDAWALGSSPSPNSGPFRGTSREYPTIGFYASPYETRNFLIKINANNASQSPVIPDSIRQLNEFKNTEYKKDFFICCWGTLLLNEHEDKQHNSDLNNLIYHGFLAKSLGKTGPEAFNEPVPMGVFNFDGIQPNDLSQNSLSALSVNFHDEQFSPNNARFKIQPGRTIATFWSVAVAPDKSPNKFMAITYNLIVNAQNLTDIIERINRLATTGPDLLGELTTLANQHPGPDRQALLKFVGTINDLQTIKK